MTDSTDKPVTGEHTITFRLYGENGNSFWTEEQDVTLDLSGRFSVTLGSDNDNTLDPVDFTGTTSIGIQVGTESELAPPQQLTSVAYALNAANGTPPGGIIMWSGRLMMCRVAGQFVMARWGLLTCGDDLCLAQVMNMSWATRLEVKRSIRLRWRRCRVIFTKLMPLQREAAIVGLVQI